MRRYNAVGVGGLVSRSALGRMPKLTEAQMQELRKMVLGDSDPKHHKMMRWRCIDPHDEVAQRFSMTVNESTIGKWLRKLWLTRL